MLFEKDVAVRMPLLALRGLVVFPKNVASFDVARKKSANALKAAMDGNRYIFVVTQKDFYAEDPTEKDLYKIGCCRGDVTERIKNAVNEPTYLMSEVKVELTVRCYNLNVRALEGTIHQFF